jgi:hypothetical protein
MKWILNNSVADSSFNLYVFKVGGVNTKRSELNYTNKSYPVTGLEGPEGCEMLRLPHFPVYRLTDGDEVVSLTRWPPFTHRKIPGTHFC